MSEISAETQAALNDDAASQSPQSQSPQLPSQSPAAPPKRKRGRPPKGAHRHDAKASDGASSADESAEAVKRKRGRPKGSASRAPHPAVTAEESLRLRADLIAGSGVLGVLLSPVFPVTGTTIVMRAEPAAAALVEIGERNARVLAVLRTLTAAGPYAALGGVGLSILAAAAVDMGAIKPDAMIPQQMIPDVLEQFRAAETPAPGNSAEPVAA